MFIKMHRALAPALPLANRSRPLVVDAPANWVQPNIGGAGGDGGDGAGGGTGGIRSTCPSATNTAFNRANETARTDPAASSVARAAF